ncbi:restriction endonuclease subunit S [Candidatus Pseudothioglobus singularis]|nr:restriction endonuclease subunit S [Candidatus Pseudothioglobus singularis]
MTLYENISIEDFAEVTSSKRIFLNDYVEEGIPFWRSKEVIEQFNGSNISNELFITEEKYYDIKDRFGVPKCGNILVTSVGTIGVPFLVKDDSPFYFKDGNLTWIKNISDSVDPKYLFLWISSQIGQKTIDNQIIGSSQKALTISALKKIKVPIPPLPTQKKIAKILSNYDYLIEKNLKRINLLEESAKLAYEEWFLRFRIDGVKLEIDSNSGLPYGWEWKLLKDFGEVVTGKTPSTNNEDYFGGNIPFVKTPSMHGNPYTLETQEYLTKQGASTQKNKFLSKNSLMVSCIGTAGVYSLVANDCQTNQQINSIKFFKDEYSFYIFGFAGYLTSILDAIGSNGATMTNVNKTKFENIKVAMPSTGLLEKFHNTYSSNFEAILNIMKQNQLLKEARDILLPRMMTGKINTDALDVDV